MPKKKHPSRDQLQMLSLGSLIDKDHIVRSIDSFCNNLDLDHLQFKQKGQFHEGRPAYEARMLLKLYIYGYMHGIRSTRKLEHASLINVELWWLLNNAKPCYKTIADFRKDNAEGFYGVFEHLRHIGLDAGLYGKKTVAIDGSKFRAQNSKKNNYNAKKIKQHQEYIEHQLEEYFEELDLNDRRCTAELDQEQKEKLLSLRERKAKYDRLEEQLKESGELQISTVDPDARALPLHMNIIEVGYNVQSTVDDKHNLIVDFEITNKKDDHVLADLAIQAKESLELNQEETLTVLADKGYHTAEQLHRAQEQNIDTLVAVKRNASRSTVKFVKEDFKYNSEGNYYSCPVGKKLTTNDRWLERKSSNNKVHRFKRYTIRYSICESCPYFDDCITAGKRKASHGRSITRNEFESALERNAEQVSARKTEYKRRQAIVEHPFGTIKRQWGHTHSLLKGKKKVDAEFSLIFLVYNFKRMINILGQNSLKKALKAFKLQLLSLRTLTANITKQDHLILHTASHRLSLSYLQQR